MEHFQGVNKKAIYDQLGLPDKCPLSPLHIALILLKYKTEYEFKLIWIKALHTTRDHSKHYIEKLISQPLTQFTVNELFPNGLSPLDVARQFNFHDIACMIERAGGGPGMWADLPKEIKEKGISSLVSLKALLSHDIVGQEAALRIFSHLFGGLPSMTSAEDDAREKILQSKPELRHIVKHVLPRLHHLDRWFDVGILLGVEEDELLTIQSDSKQDRVAYRTMLSTWLKHGRHVTWQNLFDALWDYEPGRIVEEMKKNIVEELTQSQDEAPLMTTPSLKTTCLVISKSSVSFTQHPRSPSSLRVPRRCPPLDPPSSDGEPHPKICKWFDRDHTLTEDRLLRLVGVHMDAKWNEFATHLHVEWNVREGVRKQYVGDVRDCFIEVTGRWLSGEVGTGERPRTWETVFDALRATGYPLLVRDVKEALSKEQ
jgi:hypothetical protein